MNTGDAKKMPPWPVEMDKRYNPATQDYEMSEQEKRTLLKRLNADHASAWTNQKVARQRWAKLDAYVSGRQVWDSESNEYVGHETASEPSATNNVDDEAFIFNTTRRIHSSNVQRLSAYSIQPTVIPNSSKPNDKAGARMGRVALADMFRRLGEKKLKRRIAVILDKYGCVFIKNYYDPTRGRLINPIEINPMTGEAYINTKKFEAEGEVVLEAWRPGNIVLPRYCRELENADWLEEVHVESVAWVWRKFGKKVSPETINSVDGYGPAEMDLEQPDTEFGDKMPEDSVVLKARYINPCPDFSRGAIIFYTRDHILRCTDLLSFADSLQDIWSVAEAISDEKTPFGTSWLWDIIPVQDSLNADLSAIVNYIKMCGLLQMQTPAMANIKLEKVSEATGKIYTYQGEKGLEYLRPPELQQSHFSVFNLLNTLSMSLGAAHDISRTNRALSGNALATLQQMDDTVLRPAVESIGEALEKACRNALKLMAEFYTTPRLVKMSGMQGWEIIEDFKGELLGDNFDAHIGLMTGLSNNPIVRQESIYKALKEKVIDATEARVHLEFGDAEGMLEEIQKQRELADRVVQGIADYPGHYITDPRTGEEVCKVVPHNWDNHELIITRLLAFMRENYDHMEPRVKQELDAQLQIHQDFLRQLKTPAQGGPPAPEAMSPEMGFGADLMGGAPGQAPAPGGAAGGAGALEASLRDSVQDPGQQPDRGMIPAPGFTGGAQA